MYPGHQKCSQNILRVLGREIYPFGVLRVLRDIDYKAEKLIFK